MPTYAFDCFECRRETIYLLHGKDTLNIRDQRCEWCGSDDVRLRHYYRDSGELIEALQNKIAELECRADALDCEESPDMLDD